MTLCFWLAGSTLLLAAFMECRIVPLMRADLVSQARVWLARLMIVEVTWSLLFLIAVC